MKSVIKESFTPQAGAKGYVVMGQNLEYNDETFSQWGEILASQQVYSSIENAKSEFINILKSNYGYMKLYEIESYSWGEAIGHPLYEAFESLNGPMDHNEDNLSTYIDWLNQFSTVVEAEVIKALPPYLGIYEVEYK